MIFIKVFSLEPNNARNYYRRGLAYVRDHDADKARADFKMALAKDRRMKEATRALYRLGIDSKKWKTKTPADSVQLKSAASAAPMEAKAPAETKETRAASNSAPEAAAKIEPKAQIKAEPVKASEDEPKPNERQAHTAPARRVAKQTREHHYYSEPRRDDTRRPTVRYYYYRDGRQVTFSEAFR